MSIVTKKRFSFPQIETLLLLVFLCSTQPFLDAQSELNISTKSFSAKDGLLDNVVTAITQDRRGFLWVGTHAGLEKFDGYTFMPVIAGDEHNEDFSGDNNIYDLIYQDDRLWICTQNGLWSYTIESGKYTKLNFPEGKFNGSSPGFHRIYPASGKRFWLLSDSVILLAGLRFFQNK